MENVISYLLFLLFDIPYACCTMILDTPDTMLLCMCHRMKESYYVSGI